MQTFINNQKINTYMKKKKKTNTMKDIALASGTSISTVSRVFDTKEKNKISAKTCKKIEKIAAKMGYVPNRSARALIRGGTETIGLVFPNSTYFEASEYFAKVIMNATAFLRDYNYDIKVHILRFGEEVESLSAIKQHLNVDGLIMAGIPLSDQFKDDSLLEESVVMINSGQRSGITTISPDNAQGGYLAAEYFHKKGYKKLGLITCLPDNSDMIERRNGFIKYLKENKLKINEKWFLNCEPGINGGVNAGNSLLKTHSRPTAVFCVTDETALGVMSAMRELKFKCPNDLAIIGFDNLAIAQYLSPPLTTIEQPIAEITQAAVEILLKIIKTNFSPTHTVFPVKLIERLSV